MPQQQQQQQPSSSSLWNKMKEMLPQKPVKQIYRFGLLTLLFVILNNTTNTSDNNNTITGMITGVIRNNICAGNFSQDLLSSSSSLLLNEDQL